MQGEAFQFFLPVRLIFGEGKIRELGAVTRDYGKRALLVTTPWDEAQRPLFEKAAGLLREAGLAVAVFDQVCPNPTVDRIDAGARLAREEGADVIVGVGGGSSLDTAKAIAVGASHPGSVWDYVVSADRQPTERTLPVVAVTTTSGTGSQCTQGAVLTHSALSHKSAICSPYLFPRAGIVDPELMASMPLSLTLCTGFDAFSHALEATLHSGHTPLTDGLAADAIRRILTFLPRLADGAEDPRARWEMAYADTLAGLCNANVGTTLFHSIGQAVSGRFPAVSHGAALAAIYPAVLEFSWRAAVSRCAAAARLFEPGLAARDDEEAAAALSRETARFLERIGLRPSLRGLGVPEEALPAIAQGAMGYTDTYVHPVVPTGEEILELLRRAW